MTCKEAIILMDVHALIIICVHLIGAITILVLLNQIGGSGSCVHSSLHSCASFWSAWWWNVEDREWSSRNCTISRIIIITVMGAIIIIKNLMSSLYKEVVRIIKTRTCHLPLHPLQVVMHKVSTTMPMVNKSHQIKLVLAIIIVLIIIIVIIKTIIISHPDRIMLNLKHSSDNRGGNDWPRIKTLKNKWENWVVNILK